MPNQTQTFSICPRHGQTSDYESHGLRFCAAEAHPHPSAAEDGTRCGLIVRQAELVRQNSGDPCDCVGCERHGCASCPSWHPVDHLTQT